MKLLGKVAIVTGGSGLIGKAIVEELAREGADVVFTYMKDKSSADLLVSIVKKYKREALSLKCDVKNPKDIENVVNATIKEFKKVDILVNNAGVGYPCPITETTDEIWEDTMNIDLKGPFYFIKYVVSHMIKQKYGKIINISSTGGLYGIDLHSAHGAAKGGLVGFTKNLAVELGRHNINVNAIAPGTIRTSISDPKIINQMMEKVPLKRIGRPLDVARAVVFLASSDSDYITGETLIVDGGRCALW